MIAAIAAVVSLLAAGPVRARAGDDGDVTSAVAVAAIRTELQREVTAWNGGDLDGYLAGYERATTTMMIGRSIYRGWDAIAAHYRAGYGGAARMGRLEFADLEVKPLAGDYAVVVGRWILQRGVKEGGDASGYFTLTMHRVKIGWRIMVDHTS